MSLPAPALLAFATLAAVLGAGCGDAVADDEAAFEEARARAVRAHESGGKLDEVIALLEAARAYRPDGYGLNHRLGQCYTEIKLYGEALACFERALAARPDDQSTLLTIVRLLARIGRPAEVLERVDPLLEVPGLRGAGLFRKAEALGNLGRFEEAVAVASEGAELEPAGEAYRCASLLGRFQLEEGRFAEAEHAFRRALRGRPDHKEAVKGLADSLRRLGRTEDATHWDEVLELLNGLHDNVYLKESDSSPRKRTLLERLTAVYPEHRQGFVDLAEVCAVQGDRDAACRAIDALARHESDPETLAALRARYCGATR